MNYQICFACTSRQGKVRGNHEDNLYYDGHILPAENSGLEEIVNGYISVKEPAAFAVFDGMGGESNGEYAAFAAASCLKDYMEKSIADLRQAIDEQYRGMNHAVCRIGDEYNSPYAGTTAAIIYFHRQGVYISNIGDSRIYFQRGETFKQLSVDHVRISQNQSKGKLTQHLGIPAEEMIIQPFISKCSVETGDRFLLCSDGLTDLVKAEEIGDALKENIDLSQRVAKLINLVMERGAHDNTTIILCEVEQKPRLWTLFR